MHARFEKHDRKVRVYVRDQGQHSDTLGAETGYVGQAVGPFANHGDAQHRLSGGVAQLTIQASEADIRSFGLAGKTVAIRHKDQLSCLLRYTGVRSPAAGW